MPTEGKERLRYFSAWAIALATVGAVVGWLIVAGAGISTGQVPLLVALVGLSAVATASGFALARTTSFDAAFVAALLALVLLGPVAAVIVGASNVALDCLILRLSAGARSQRRVAVATNFASVCIEATCGWLAFLATITLLEPALGGMTFAAAVVAASAAAITANFVGATLLISCLVDGERFWPIARVEFISAIPSHLLLIALAALTAFGYLTFGLIALALFAVAVIVPQHLFLPRLQARYERLANAEPVSRLEGFDLYDRISALAVQLARVQNGGRDVEKLYCIGSEMFREYRIRIPVDAREDMSDFDKRQTTLAINRLVMSLSHSSYELMVEDDRDIIARPHVFKDHGQLAAKKAGAADSDYQAKVRREKTRPDRSLVPYRLADDASCELFDDVRKMLESCFECETGDGFPSGLSGNWRGSAHSGTFQVAAVIASLQDRGYSDDEIVMELRDRAGTQFEPQAVNAAAELVAQEKAALEGQTHFKPRFHSIPAPSFALRIASPILGLNQAA